MITREQCQAVTGDADTWFIPLRDSMALHGIDARSRVASFLAQCAHESAGFKRLTEDLHYSAASLLRVFGQKYFTPELAIDMAFDEERIANHVYGSRLGNGNEASGDGYRYRGRGIFMLTGRANYRAYGRTLGIDLEAGPERAAEPLNAALIAGAFWDVHACNALADQGDFEEITRRINGGMNGINERLAALDRVQRVLTA